VFGFGQVGDLKLHTSGQGFTGHHIEIDTNTMGGVEGALIGVLGESVFAEQIVGKGEGGQPGAGNLHFHGGRAAGGGNHHTGGEKESQELFHDAHP